MTHAADRQARDATPAGGLAGVGSRDLLDSASDAIFALDREWRFVYLNVACERFAGRPRGELLGRTLWELFPLMEPTALGHAYRQAMHERVVAVAEEYLEPLGMWIAVRAIPAHEGIVVFGTDVSEQRRLQREAAESARRARAMFEALPLQAYAWSRDGDDFVLTDFNAAAARATEGKIRDFLGVRLGEFYADMPEMRAIVEQVAADGVTRHEEREFAYRTTGRVRRVSITYTCAAPDLVLMQAEDLTEQRQAEALFRGIAEQAIAGIYVFQDDRHVYVNPHYAHLLGYTVEEVLERHGWEWVVHPSARDEVRARIASRLHGARDDQRYNVRLLRKDGEPLEVEVHGTSILYRGRRALLGAVVDMTAHHAAEEQRRRQAQVFELMHDAIFVADGEQRILEWSPSAERTFGWTRGEVLGRRPTEFLHPPEVAQSIAADLRDALLRDGRWEQVVPFVRRDGSRGMGEAVIVGHGGVGGAHAYGIGVVRDITARHEAEAALRSSEERYRLATQVTRDVVWEWDLVTGAIRRSDAMAAVFGYPLERAFGSNAWWRAQVHPDDVAATAAGFDAAIASDAATWSAEYRFRRADGAWATVLDRAQILRDGDGRAVRAVGAVTDVTSERLLEARLRQSEKMEAVGQLAGGIAHDFNNLLTVITAHTEFLIDTLGRETEQHDDALQIRAASARAAALTRQLLAFSRRQVLRPQPLDLNAAVVAIHPMLRRLIGEDIAIALQPARGLWHISADPGQLEQVVLNLAINARDAMADGGTITIVSANVTAGGDSPLAAATPGAAAIVPGAVIAGGLPIPPGDYVRLSVADTGHGIPPEIRSRIFDPFFTTKGLGQGTGLGLATVFGIVQQSGGYVTCASTVGRGTRFDVFLPRLAEEPPAPAVDRPSDAVARGAETVLVVEDEPAVRALTERMLARQGYRVHTAISGADAMRRIDDEGLAFDVLLTDMVMPGMSGSELYRRLASRRPGVPVLFMSGYTDDEFVRRGLTAGSGALLEKPFTAERLHEALRGVLARAASRGR